MSGEKRSSGVEPIYSMLVGGLMASFVAVVVFTAFSDQSEAWVPFATALVGLAAAGAFMVVGMAVANRLPWLSGGLLFASGFTALWAVAMSFSVESKWVLILALGAAIAMGIALGRWRFGSGAGAQCDASDPVPQAGA